MKASELLLQSAEPFDKACMIVREMEAKMQKKIYRVLWYNSDGYGIMGSTSVVVQAESANEASILAKEHLMKFLNDVENHLRQYESAEVEDISDKTILSVDISTI